MRVMGHSSLDLFSPRVAANGKMCTSVVGDVSAQVLELARKQRMNTDVRRNIFCILMTSEVSCGDIIWD